MAAVACFVLGAGLLFPFDATLTITFGVLLLGAAIVCGVFVLASPDRLSLPPDRSSPHNGRDDPSARGERRASR
jgi:hypothetical protein